MKKLFSLLLLALLTMSVWAANTYSYTFTSKTFSGNGTVTLNNVDWTLDCDGGYFGYDGTKGQQFGSGSNPCHAMTLTTSDIAGTITKVTINASTGNSAVATMDVTVGGVSYISESLTSAATNYVGEGTSSGEVKIQMAQPNTSKALYIKSIEIEYEGAAVSVAAPEFHPNGGPFTETSLPVTITCADSPCDIFYCEGDTLDWTTAVYYSGEFYVTETKTFTAVAVKSNIMSDPTTVTFTKVEPMQDGIFLPINFTSFPVKNGDVTIDCTNGLINAEQFRFYKNSTITFTSTGADIVGIEFTCTANGDANYGPGAITPQNGGTYAYENKIGTWAGKSDTVIFLADKNQLRATKIVVTLDDGTTAYVAAPTLPESCEFTESMTVTITNNEPGSTIMYSCNDGAYTEYNEPFPITETTTVKAYAEYDGTTSEVVTATYTLAEPDPGITTLAQVNALDNNTEFTFMGDAVVTAQEGQYLWLRDASGYGLIYGTIDATFTNSQVLAKGWTAKKTTYKNLVEYTNAANLSADGTNAQMGAIQEITALSNDMINAYVMVKNVTGFTVSGQNVTATLSDGTTMVMFNKFNKEIPSEEGNYTVEGAVNIYNNDLQLYILKIEGFVPQINDVNNIAEAYNLNPNSSFTMYNDVVVTYHDVAGKRLYIRDTEDNSGMIYGTINESEDYPEFSNGDVLSDGWTAVFSVYQNSPEFTGATGIAASGDTRVAAPFERNAEEIAIENVHEYVILKGQTILPDTTGNANADKRFYIDLPGDSLVLYNQFGVELPTIETGNTYDVTGIVTLYRSKPQVYITEMTKVNNVVRGDVNGDTFVNITDAIQLINAILTSDSSAINTQNSDVTGDTLINITDAIQLINYISTGHWYDE